MKLGGDRVAVQQYGPVRVIELHGRNEMNPFSRSLELAVIEACEDAQNDEETFAIVLYGGKGRAFSAGGDLG